LHFFFIIFLYTIYFTGLSRIIGLQGYYHQIDER